MDRVTIAHFTFSTWLFYTKYQLDIVKNKKGANVVKNTFNFRFWFQIDLLNVKSVQTNKKTYKIKKILHQGFNLKNYPLFREKIHPQKNGVQSIEAVLGQKRTPPGTQRVISNQNCSNWTSLERHGSKPIWHWSYDLAWKSTIG